MAQNFSTFLIEGEKRSASRDKSEIFGEILEKIISNFWLTPIFRFLTGCLGEMESTLCFVSKHDLNQSNYQTDLKFIEGNKVSYTKQLNSYRLSEISALD